MQWELSLCRIWYWEENAVEFHKRLMNLRGFRPKESYDKEISQIIDLMKIRTKDVPFLLEKLIKAMLNFNFAERFSLDKVASEFKVFLDSRISLIFVLK